MANKVMIDPGHAPGNVNGGKNGYKEFAGMWKLSNYLKEALERRGVQAGLTRAEDADPSLTARGRAAAGYDLFISQHTNAANGAARGVEVFHSLRLPADKELAAELSKEISALMGNPNRGAKTRESTNTKGADYYTVISSAQAAGAKHVLLIESGFHDNAQDEAFLLFNSNLRAMADVQARIICKYIGASDAPPANTAPPVQPPSNAGGLTPITGITVATAAQLRAYISNINPAAPDIAAHYITEGEREGVRGDIAFAQSCIETGNFKYVGSAVTPDQHNYCGMGVTSTGMKGNSFNTAAEGIRAQIQHLKAYANTEPLKGALLSPRFQYVERGVSPYVEWLGTKENPKGKGWATGAGYGEKILKVLASILKTDAQRPAQPPTPSAVFTPYAVWVKSDELNIRCGAGTGNAVTGVIKDRGIYTIVKESNGTGAKKWGRLKSGAGWISLDFTQRA